MNKQAALIERVRLLHARLQSCQPEDETLRLDLLVELAAIYKELAGCNK